MIESNVPKRLYRFPMRWQEGHRRLWLWVSLLWLMGVVSVGCQPGAAPPAETAVSDVGVLETAVTLTDSGFVLPDPFPGGIVNVTITNDTDKAMDIGFGRVLEGANQDEILALVADPEGFIPLMQMVSFIMSFNPMPAGESRQAVIEFGTGQFIVDAAEHSDGSPLPDAQHVDAFFTADTLEGTVEPDAAVQVELLDFAYTMSEAAVSAGKHLWQYHNGGEQWHMMLLVKVNEGTTVEDVLAFMGQEEPSGPPPFEFMENAGIPPIGPGERTWVEFDLEPGTYMAICPLPDAAAIMSGGMPTSHAEHGMHWQFEVK